MSSDRARGRRAPPGAASAPAGASPVDVTALRAEMAELRARLAEAEDTLTAIRSGDVDALVVGNDIYTLDSANAASNSLRKDVLAQMDDAVLAFDRQDHLIYLNPAAERQYLTRPSEALGRHKTDLFREEWPDQADAPAAQLGLAEVASVRSQSVHHLLDGRVVNVEATLSRLSDAAGEVVGYLAVIRDVTERMRAEKALRETDQRKDEFLATLAHELRNPLAPIRNALEIMQLTHDVAKQDKARAIIARQLQQLVHLVDDLLDVSRINQGKVELRLEDVDVAEAVQAAVETSRPLVDAGRHALSVRLPVAASLVVRADATRLTQIIANLLNNSAKYTPLGGRIDVIAERRGALARIEVRDTGIGIPPVYLPRVFDMFAQIDQTLQRSQGGLGIGLALVKRLVEMHGGSVEAQSEGTGRGSTFVVELPLADHAMATPAAPDPPATASSASDSNLRVLVVDDNVDSATSLSLVLSMLGYRTQTAHDGHDALEVAETFRPRAVVLDIGLPGLSGHEVAQQLRRAAWGRGLILIALSGWGRDEDRRKSRDAGFDHHFVKPVDIKTLADLLAPLRAR